MPDADTATVPPAPPPATGRATGRIRGIDAARALAIIGMVMVHVGPIRDDVVGVGGTVYALPHGRAAILFGLLAGVGVSLLAGDRSRPRLRRARRDLAWRALLLLPAGLALQLLDHGVLVILHYYAAYFLVAAVVVTARDRYLLALSALLLVVGPVIHLAAWQRWPDWFTATPTEWGDPPAVVVRGLLLAGSYPVITWAGPLLFGLWLGRRDLADRSLRWRLVVVGAAGAAAAAALSAAARAWLPIADVEPSWWQLLSDEPHSQMPLWLLGATASACAVLGATLLVCERFPRATWPLAATGQLALTIYVGHLLVLHVWPAWLERPDAGAAAMSVLRFSVVVGVAAVAWRALALRGPLEALLRLPRWRPGR